MTTRTIFKSVRPKYFSTIIVLPNQRNYSLLVCFNCVVQHKMSLVVILDHFASGLDIFD